MRKNGSSGELSTTALEEEKQGSAAVTHQSRQRGGDGVDKMQGGGGVIGMLHEAKQSCAGVC
jgi:hypothetical protein